MLSSSSNASNSTTPKKLEGKAEISLFGKPIIVFYEYYSDDECYLKHPNWLPIREVVLSTGEVKTTRDNMVRVGFNLDGTDKWAIVNSLNPAESFNFSRGIQVLFLDGSLKDQKKVFKANVFRKEQDMEWSGIRLSKPELLDEKFSKVGIAVEVC